MSLRELSVLNTDDAYARAEGRGQTRFNTSNMRPLREEQ